MNPKSAIAATSGRFFSAYFIKRDGSLRRMVARIGVSKFVSGEGLAFDPADFNLAVVWDAQKRAYRMINLSTLLSLRCGAINWRCDDGK